MSKLTTYQNTDVSSVVATTSYTFSAAYTKPMAVQAVWTSSTASFTIALESSLDGTNYQAFTTATTITNSSSTVIWDAKSIEAPYWRVTATRTSGTLTTLKVYVSEQSRS